MFAMTGKFCYHALTVMGLAQFAVCSRVLFSSLLIYFQPIVGSYSEWYPETDNPSAKQITPKLPWMIYLKIELLETNKYVM